VLSLGTAPILAVLVGIFHSGLFFFLGGRGGLRLILTIGAAILGAWAGDAVGGRLGFDAFRLGDFRLLPASIMAWLGIGFVEVISILGPERREGRPL
jgi:hypothetical membrane protein